LTNNVLLRDEMSVDIVPYLLAQPCVISHTRYLHIPHISSMSDISSRSKTLFVKTFYTLLHINVKLLHINHFMWGTKQSLWLAQLVVVFSAIMLWTFWLITDHRYDQYQFQSLWIAIAYSMFYMFLYTKQGYISGSHSWT
jgi:hypothetical protein